MLLITSYIVQEHGKENKFCKHFLFSVYTNFDITWENVRLAQLRVTEGVGWVQSHHPSPKNF